MIFPLPKNKKTEAGFTLVEVLIAMFIFSLISIGATSALTTSLRSKAHMDKRLAFMNEIDMARALMRSDFMQIKLRKNRDAYGGDQPYVLSGGVEDLICFTRGGRINPGGLQTRSEFERVSYIFEGGKLIRRSLNQDNPAPNTGFRDTVLFTDLDEAKMTFLIKAPLSNMYRSDQFDTKEVILIAPEQITNLPSVIVLTLVFKNGDKLTQNFEVNL